MAVMSVSLRSITDTQAAIGWSGGHSVVIDRPEGRAGGMGLGFNGGQMIALAIGGCYCNDLRYVAETMGVAIHSIAVEVDIELDGTPALVAGATMRVSVDADGPVNELLARANADSTVANSIRHGFPISIVPA